ncbi:unnamed protein product [Laminaria digitata]
MPDSPPPKCENCKPGEATEERETAVADAGCQETYGFVVSCMEAHRGNVADCRAEWQAFRACHSSQKKSQAT